MEEIKKTLNEIKKDINILTKQRDALQTLIITKGEVNMDNEQKIVFSKNTVLARLPKQARYGDAGWDTYVLSGEQDKYNATALKVFLFAYYAFVNRLKELLGFKPEEKYCESKHVCLSPGESILLDTGMKANFELNTMLKVEPRSSIALKGIGVGACIIDYGYYNTGKSIKINLVNCTKHYKFLNLDEPVAQLIQYHIEPPYGAEKIRTGGFGSTNDSNK